MEKITNIGGRLHNTAVGGAVAGANEIKDDTKGKMQNVINSETDAELVRLNETKQNNLTFDQTPKEESANPVTSGGVYAADAALQQAIEAILLLIPSAASALNQLADKAFVNSSISTATATPRGTYNVVTDLHLAVDATHQQIEAALSEVITMADKNDYCYVQVPVSSDSPDIQRTERYKFNSDAWIYEYDLNTSGYTAAQWAAINSGITSALVGDLNAIKTYIPSEATALNQLADKAYVLAQIIANTPAFKGQFTTLSELQAVQSPKAGDIGIVRTKDSDGHDVFTFYQYKDDQWNEFYTLSYHPQLKPASTGVNGNYPFNGMGRVELPMNMVDGWLNDTWVYYPKNGVVYLLYSWNFQLYAVYNSLAQEGLGLDNNLVVKPANYNIADISDIVGNRYLSFTEDGGVYTGGMCDSFNYGIFTIEKGGIQIHERGHLFSIDAGTYTNEGTLAFGGGGEFRFNDGEFINNGTIIWNLGNFGPSIRLNSGNYVNNGKIYLRDNRGQEENMSSMTIDDSCKEITMNAINSYNP